jgi:hypothetical protein
MATEKIHLLPSNRGVASPLKLERNFFIVKKFNSFA